MSASVTSQVGHRGSLVWLHTKAHCECLTTARSEALSLISVRRVDNYSHNVSCRTSSHMTGRLQCVGAPVGCQSTRRGWLEQKLLSLGLRRDTAFQSNCQRMKKKKSRQRRSAEGKSVTHYHNNDVETKLRSCKTTASHPNHLDVWDCDLNFWHQIRHSQIEYRYNRSHWYNNIQCKVIFLKIHHKHSIKNNQMF